ncbi:MAG: leucyl aminopeptidase, partial [Chloroflexi bacterium]|nr:leucyl aminopeptidase [Chloroflexota bacterium]
MSRQGKYSFASSYEVITAPGSAQGPVVVFKNSAALPAPGQPGKKVGEVVLLQESSGGMSLIVSLGEARKATPAIYRQAGSTITRWLKKHGSGPATLDLDASDLNEVPGSLAALLEGIFLGDYEFTRYLTSRPEPVPALFFLLCAPAEQQAVAAAAQHAHLLSNAVNLARDWAQEPANVINPISLAGRVQELVAGRPIQCTVLDDTQLAAMHAGGILSVGQGSHTPARMIVLEYSSQSAAASDPVVLVGKAITFDTGGYSLKSVESIRSMKYDKCGGVDVIATLLAAADLGLDVHLVGIVCAAENMISDTAYRPDDILTTLSGKTIEIITTDAEGRLVLADGLTYAQRNFKPRALIDLATLTGGVITALGRVRAGMMTNNEALAGALFRSGEATHERLWQLPLDDDYEKAIRGDDSDFKNSGGREGHPIMGGIFLKQFIENDVPWAHLDIAGMSDYPKDMEYAPKGASGFGIRLLV